MLVLAFLGGILTILSPCILPVLPLVFARGGRSFMREIPIPNDAQMEKVQATFENEILTVLLPVPRNGQSRRLSARVWADLERAETLN